MPSYDTIVLLRISKALRIKLHVDLIFDATFKTTLSFDSVSKISKLSGFSRPVSQVCRRSLYAVHENK